MGASGRSRVLCQRRQSIYKNKFNNIIIYIMGNVNILFFNMIVLIINFINFEQNVNFRGGGKGFGDAEAVELLGDSFNGGGD